MLGQSAIDGLRLNLDMVEKIVDRPLINNDELTDLGAYLNAATARAAELNTKLKGRLKAELIGLEKDQWQGKVFQAEIKWIDKTYLLTDKVKKFLGKKLDDYQEVRAEVHLSYKPRS